MEFGVWISFLSMDGLDVWRNDGKFSVSWPAGAYGLHVQDCYYRVMEARRSGMELLGGLFLEFS